MAAGQDPLASAKALMSKVNKDYPSSFAKSAGAKPAGEYAAAPYHMAATPKVPKPAADPAEPIKQMGGDAQAALDNKKKIDALPESAAIKQ